MSRTWANRQDAKAKAKRREAAAATPVLGHDGQALLNAFALFARGDPYAGRGEINPIHLAQALSVYSPHPLSHDQAVAAVSALKVNPKGMINFVSFLEDVRAGERGP